MRSWSVSRPKAPLPPPTMEVMGTKFYLTEVAAGRTPAQALAWLTSRMGGSERSWAKTLTIALMRELTNANDDSYTDGQIAALEKASGSIPRVWRTVPGAAEPEQAGDLEAPRHRPQAGDASSSTPVRQTPASSRQATPSSPTAPTMPSVVPFPGFTPAMRQPVLSASFKKA